MKAFLVPIFICFLIPLGNVVTAQNAGFSLKASTSGIGGDIGYRASDKFLIKTGYETIYLDYSTSYSESGFSFDAAGSFKTGNISLLIDYQLFRFLYLSSGMLLNNTSIMVNAVFTEDYLWGDVIIPKEDMGAIEWKVSPKYSFSPYLGVGFGNNLSSKRIVSFSFEIGGIFQGSPQVDILSSGILSPNQDPDFNQSGILEKQISEYRFYPTLKLQLGFNIIKF